jgi:nucleoredoxin
MAAIVDLFGEGNIHGKNGEKVNVKQHFAGKTVGIYFSAHWCPPCRDLTPVSPEFYNKHHQAKNFEIIFVSSDKSGGEFEEYYNEMPWYGF